MDKQAIIKALRDTAQSASNTVADTAAVPLIVDIDDPDTEWSSSAATSGRIEHYGPGTLFVNAGGGNTKCSNLFQFGVGRSVLINGIFANVQVKNGTLLAANDDSYTDHTGGYSLASTIIITVDAGEYRVRAGVCCGDPTADRFYGNHYYLISNFDAELAPGTPSATWTPTPGPPNRLITFILLFQLLIL